MDFAISGNSKGEVVELLKERYELGKSAIYTRLELIGISIEKSEGVSGLKQQELDKLDRLNKWIGDGNSADTFPEKAETGIVLQGETGIDTQSLPIEDVKVEAPSNDFIELYKQGAELAAGAIMAQHEIARLLVENPHALPNHLRQQIEESKRNIAPKLKAATYRDQFLQMVTPQTQEISA